MIVCSLEILPSRWTLRALLDKETKNMVAHCSLKGIQFNEYRQGNFQALLALRIESGDRTLQDTKKCTIALFQVIREHLSEVIPFVDSERDVSEELVEFYVCKGGTVPVGIKELTL
ncbi:hypothetical protein P5673_030558 [Acropora cervicornis]|uniref:Uncharacterized protein n=1 Tax=Acropora cervicornis TaxID=6130 RepID=A0AAD9UT67_ACRCE|nr:hypothetical protein P5673_030558 [Acropora cervicornis]